MILIIITLSAILGLLWGAREAFYADSTVFEKRFKVSKYSFFGSHQWERKYKTNRYKDENGNINPIKTQIFGNFGIDYWHTSTYIMWAMFITVCIFSTQTWLLLINMITQLLFGNLSYKWFRSKPFWTILLLVLSTSLFAQNNILKQGGFKLDTISIERLSKINTNQGDVIRFNGISWESGSPFFEQTWYDFQATTVAQTVTSPFTNTTDSENNFLIVSGTAGNNTLTIVSGNGALFDVKHGAVVKNKTNNSYYPVLVTDVNGSSVSLGQPLPVNFTNDTLKCIQESQNGQHFTKFGYKALADEMLRRKRYLSDRTKYIAAFLPEKDGNATIIPFELYGGVSTGGFVPGSSNTMFNTASVMLENISEKQQYRYHYRFDQGGSSGKGFKWTVNTGQHKGHVNFLMSVSNTGTANPAIALVKLTRKIDNTILFSKIVFGEGTQEIDFPFENEDDLTLSIETYNSDPLSVRVNRMIWYYRIEESLTKSTFDDATKVVFYGDSWTVFHDTAMVKHLRSKLPSVQFLSKGRGGMTGKWGGRWIRQEVVNMNPKPSHVVINFRINDHNSFGSSSTAWSFSSTGAYAVGTDIFGGMLNGKEWYDSLQSMKKVLLENNIIPIFLEDHTTASNSQQISQMDTLAKYWNAPKFYSTGKLTVTDQILGGNALLDELIADTISVTANSFSRIWGRNNGVSQPSLTIRPIDTNASDAQSVVIRPLTDRTAGNALVIQDRQGNSIHKFRWAGATSTYSAGYIESGWFVANYPFSGGGFQTNGLSLSQNGGIGAIQTNTTQSRFELGFGAAGYNSIWTKIRGTTALSGFTIYNSVDSVILIATKDKRLGIGVELPQESIHTSGLFRSNSATGTGDQVAYFDANGVLRRTNVSTSLLGIPNLQSVTNVGYITTRSIRSDSFLHVRNAQHIMGLKLENTDATGNVGRTWDIASTNEGQLYFKRSDLSRPTLNFTGNTARFNGVGYFGGKLPTGEGILFAVDSSATIIPNIQVENKLAATGGASAWFTNKVAADGFETAPVYQGIKFDNGGDMDVVQYVDAGAEIMVTEVATIDPEGGIKAITLDGSGNVAFGQGDGFDPATTGLIVPGVHFTNGALGLNHFTSATSLTLSATVPYYVNIFNGTSLTCTLPTPSAANRQSFIVKFVNAGTITGHIDGTSGTNISVLAGQSFLFFSDGTTFWRLTN